MSKEQTASQVIRRKWKVFFSLLNPPYLYHNLHGLCCLLSFRFTTWMSALIPSSPYINPLCDLIHIKGKLLYSEVSAAGLLGWACFNSQLSVGEPLHFDLTNMHLRCLHISWKYFCRDYPTVLFCSWSTSHQFSVFDCIHYKHLLFRLLLLSTYLTFHVDLWQCKWFQPLVSVCSLCLLVFFMKVLSSILSNSSAIDTYIKFADDKSRECAERILISTSFLYLYPVPYKMSHTQH